MSPTDIAQFVRLDQCRRFLRLRLHEARSGRAFLHLSGVTPQEAPPLLATSGVDFEATAIAELQGSQAVEIFTKEARLAAGRHDDNLEVVEAARALLPGASLSLLQPRLRRDLNGWLLTGDLDVLRLSRAEDGRLTAFIADMKSSASSKVEHRLQVAFYRELLHAIYSENQVECAAIDLGIIYRGDFDESDQTSETVTLREVQQAAAMDEFGISTGYLDRVDDPEAYASAVRELVTGPRSVARQTVTAEFDDIPFHLTYKCDWCRYNAFCTKWCAETDDLSLIPHLTDGEKHALTRAGVTTNVELAALKDLPSQSSTAAAPELTPVAAHADKVRELASTWPVGPRLDEVIHRARRYRRFKGDEIQALPTIPHKGHGSLPYCDASHNPNLIKIYIDAQHDYLTDRIYLVGALVVAAEGGQEVAYRRKSIVHLTDGPTDAAAEEALFLRWIDETVRALVELGAPDKNGELNAPIHLIFFNRFDQRLFLDGLARHAARILGATPLYDFVTQLAAFDSPISTFLVDEIRELKNYPMVCQSLQAVARYLKFDWNQPEPFVDLFRARLFDHIGKFGGDELPEADRSPWYTARSRFNSQIPLEYVYSAWGELEKPPQGEADDFVAFRNVTTDTLKAFQARRLEAMEWIAQDFKGNKLTEKRPFSLPDLATFDDKGRTFAHALDEFVVIERHVELNQWKSIRHMPPERRVLAGETLIARYDESDQDAGVRLKNRENRAKQQRREEYERSYRAANPEAERVELTKEQKSETNWSQEGMQVRLHIDLAEVDARLSEVMNVTTLREDERVVVFERETVDSRLPLVEQVPHTPTPKQMLYGTRARIAEIALKHDANEQVIGASVTLEMVESRGNLQGFTFGAISRPFEDGKRYTLDADPNNIYGYWNKKVTEGLIAGGQNALYDRLSGRPVPDPIWPDAAVAGQARFLQGLNALHDAGFLHGFEDSKIEFIGEHGASPWLLVQGPPGTGKSYTTAFALLARIQGAMSAGLDYRVFLSCKTHSATDVLLRNLVEVVEKLRVLSRRHREIVEDLFDGRLFELPLYRINPREDAPFGTARLTTKKVKGETHAVERILANPWVIVAAPPGGIYSLIKDRWSGDNLFGHELADCLVLDEASQMNLPEAIMATLPLNEDGRLIVVGDHRQMPPIIKHDWLGEPRRTFKEFKSYESLFTALREFKPPPPMIRFARSFRLHAEMASFLRQEIYRHDGIHYHSEGFETLPPVNFDDPFVASVLHPDYPLVVVVHDEQASQHRNTFERDLMAPVFAALTTAPLYGDDDRDGYGIVVPHRAQRSALKDVLDGLTRRYPNSPVTKIAAVDTVERFQGDERAVIVISATESDQEYLIASGKFLLDPRRLTVALSRAKRKLVLVAARSVFDLFSSDEATFANAQLWKNLLRRTCTVPLWNGSVQGHNVEVWGNEARDIDTVLGHVQDQGEWQARRDHGGSSGERSLMQEIR